MAIIVVNEICVVYSIHFDAHREIISKLVR